MTGSASETDDDMLALSGLQHLAFCPRQWGLIHLEQVWVENVRTVEGRLLHEWTDLPGVHRASRSTYNRGS
jgi:CRISPR-associated exonuclease Cas4